MQSTIKYALQLVRFPNLLIVAITQYLIQYLFLIPAFEKVGLAPALDGLEFGLFVTVTMIIAAIGYMVNDLVDYPIDLVNKREKTIVYRRFKVKNVKLAMGLLFGWGMGVSLHLALYVDNLGLASLFPIAVGLLIWYAYVFKRIAVIGNAIVSLFCAFVAGIVWFAERHTFAEMNQLDQELALTTEGILLAYMAFAFIANFYREIIKDIEDQEGDKLYGCFTLPIITSTRFAKIVAQIFLVWLLFMVVFLNVYMNGNSFYWSLGFSVLGILAPIVLSMILLLKAKSKADFHKLSRIAKLIMVSGLVLIIFLGFELFE